MNFFRLIAELVGIDKRFFKNIFWIIGILWGIYIITHKCNRTENDFEKNKAPLETITVRSYKEPDTVWVIKEREPAVTQPDIPTESESHDPYDREYWEEKYPWLDWETAIEQYENGPYEDFQIFIEEEYDPSLERYDGY